MARDLIGAARERLRRLGGEQGFGLVELLIAMTMLAVGITAVFAIFLSSELAIRRASVQTTAMTIIDVEMEKMHSRLFSTVGHTVTALASTDSTYGADPAYRAADHNSNAVLNEANDAVTIGSSTISPTSTVVGADGRSYRLDMYVRWKAVPSGRNVKLMTVVVREAASPHASLARAAKMLDQAYG